MIDITDVSASIRIVRLLLQAYVNGNKARHEWTEAKDHKKHILKHSLECDQFLAKAYQSAIVLEHKLQPAHDQPT